MRVTKSVVFGLVGLVSLVSTANAKVTGKPALAKRHPMATVTVTNDGCTAVCWDEIAFGGAIATRCTASCDTTVPTSMPTTSTSITTSTTTVTGEVPTSTSTSIEVISSSSGDCVYTCSADYELGDFDCGFECGGTPSTSMLVTTTSTEAVLAQRTVISAVDGDCTAVCWDLMPGTECDVQCSSDFQTKAPVPSKAARVANLEARENVQAHQVREARLARKFGGLVARDATVTVTSIPEYCTAGLESSISTTVAGVPAILPMQVPQEAGISAALAQASTALSAAQQEQAVSTASVSVGPSALSEASALSSMASSLLSEAVSEASVSSAEAATAGSAATVSATTTATSITSIATTAFTKATSTISKTTVVSTNGTSTSSKTTTTSATTTRSLVVSPAGSTISTSFPTAGAAREYTVSTWFVFSLLIGLAANVAFLI